VIISIQESSRLENKEGKMDDKMAIEAAITQFVKAYNAGNIDGVLAYYSENDRASLSWGMAKKRRTLVGSVVRAMDNVAE
jgi:hypothetical protein